MKALYRKYRPVKLDDVVGQEQVTSALKNSLKQGKISHAYLFIGPRGTGKTSAARIFAHAVNGFSYELEDSYLDIIEIDAASNTGVDNIRDLREKAIIAPSEGKYKVYIIDEVHMLSKSAANALLKTIEEPPEHVIFILATTEAHKVPITISSRTQMYTFKLASQEVMFNHLKNIAAKEKIKITDDALKIVVHRGGGSFRDSLSILDQVTNLTNAEITADFLGSTLGLPAEEAMRSLLQAYADGDGLKAHDILTDLINSGLAAETVASELIPLIISAPTPKTIPLLGTLTNVSSPFADAKLFLALLQNLPETSKKNPSAPITAPQNPTKPPEAPQKPVGAPEPPKSHSTADFSWEAFLSALNAESEAVAQQLQKCAHEIKDNTVHIYPTQAFTAKVLAKNDQLLMKHTGGIALLIHKPGETPKKDPTLSQISAIMGDVQEMKGTDPF